MTVFEALILGILEGLTEFLPISSTGHLTLAAHLLHLDIENDPFIKSFIVVIQLGAILAVLALYFKRFLQDMQVWKRIIVAFIPTGILGFALADVIENVFLGNDLIVVINLIGVGVLLLFVDRWLQSHQRYDDVNQLPAPYAALIGLFQAIAEPQPSFPSSWPYPPCSRPPASPCCAIWTSSAPIAGGCWRWAFWPLSYRLC
jgi:undecaprenyl-diphosphatase